MSTEMKRVTVPMPADLDKKILDMKKSDKFVRASYAEIVRVLLLRGLDSLSESTIQVNNNAKSPGG